MAIVQGIVTIPMLSGNPKDSAVMTWAFNGSDSAEDIAIEASDRLFDFYTLTATGAVSSPLDYFSNEIDAASASMKWYDIEAPEPRVPVFFIDSGLGSPDPVQAIDLPSEVAACLSFRAELVSGQPAARRRGRVFLGPLNAGAGPGSGPDGGFRSDVARAATELLDKNTANCSWGVWSRVDGAVRTVVAGYIDNAWDTQRRRGTEATVRTVFPVT